MPKITIFYSWQSDLPNGTNRSLIESCLDRAAAQIAGDQTITVEPVIDRDTRGVAGAPDIAQAILEKIDRSAVFVADVSIVNSGSSRSSPNPNVLIELGYALKSIGESRLILIQNTAFGGPEALPFDLRMKRVTTYSCDPSAPDRSQVKNHLTRRLEEAIREILSSGAPSEQESLAERVKRIFREPSKQIDVHDLISDAASEICAQFDQAKEEILEDFNGEALLERLNRYEAWSHPLEEVFRLAGEWSQPEQDRYLISALERVADPPTSGAYTEGWMKLRRYPALRLIYIAGASAVAAKNYRTLYGILVTARAWDQIHGEPEPACMAVNVPSVMSQAAGRLLPNMKSRYAPLNDYLHESIKPLFEPIVERAWTQLFDLFEYFLTLVIVDFAAQADRSFTPFGSYGWRARAVGDRFEDAQAAVSAGFFGGSLDRYHEVKALLDKRLLQLNWY